VVIPTLTVRSGVDATKLFVLNDGADGAARDQKLLEILRQLVPILEPAPAISPRPMFHEVIEPAFADLRTVHSAYVAMFRDVQKRIPPRRDHPEYQARVVVAAARLREMRADGTAVRVELRRLAEHLHGKQLSGHARTFADALLDYFPDGSLREPTQSRDAGWWKTASASLLDHIDENLSGNQTTDLAALVHDTIVTLELGWDKVCDAFQALRLAQYS
jgi:hypothetical protein